VLAVAAADGKAVWEFATGTLIRCAPAVVGGLVYCGFDSGMFPALAEETIEATMTDHQGNRLWNDRRGGACHAAPVAADGLLVVGCDDAFVYGFR